MLKSKGIETSINIINTKFQKNTSNGFQKKLDILIFIYHFINLLIYQKERNFNIKNKDRDWTQGTAYAA